MPEILLKNAENLAAENPELAEKVRKALESMIPVNMRTINFEKNSLIMERILSAIANRLLEISASRGIA